MVKKLKIIAIVMLLIIGNCFVIMSSANASIQKTVTIFYSPYCPHCHHLMDFVKSDLKDKYPEVDFQMKNVMNQDDIKDWDKFKKEAGLPSSQGGVPQTYIGSELVLGFGTPETTGVEIENKIKDKFYK